MKLKHAHRAFVRGGGRSRSAFVRCGHRGCTSTTSCRRRGKRRHSGGDSFARQLRCSRRSGGERRRWRRRPRRGESFLRVHWVAVPQAMRARRVNRETPSSGADAAAGSDTDFEVIRLVVESPCSQFTRECQRLGHPPRLNKSPFCRRPWRRRWCRPPDAWMARARWHRHDWRRWWSRRRTTSARRCDTSGYWVAVPRQSHARRLNDHTQERAPRGVTEILLRFQACT
jgi:hypothetical protein